VFPGGVAALGLVFVAAGGEALMEGQGLLAVPGMVAGGRNSVPDIGLDRVQPDPHPAPVPAPDLRLGVAGAALRRDPIPVRGLEQGHCQAAWHPLQVPGREFGVYLDEAMGVQGGPDQA